MRVLPFAMLAAAACNTQPLPTTGSNPGQTPVQSESCVADDMLPAGSSIVACGFAPHLELAGVDDQAIYAVTEGGQLFRVDQRTGAKQLLDQEDDLPVYGFGDAVQLGGGRLFFIRSSGNELWAVDAAAPAQPQPALRGATLGSAPVVDGDYVYWLRTQDTPSGQQFLDVRRTPVGGGDDQLVYDGSGYPVSTAAGSLYLTTIPDAAQPDSHSQILQVPVGGGDAHVALTVVPNTTGEGAIAAGDGGLYLLQRGASERSDCSVVRYPTAGGAGQVLASVPAPQGEVPIGPPLGLRLDGERIYYLNVYGGAQNIFGGAANLWRLDDGGSPELVLSADSLGPPKFDDQFIYVAYQRGGVTGPIEGVVAKIPK